MRAKKGPRMRPSLLTSVTASVDRRAVLADVLTHAQRAARGLRHAGGVFQAAVDVADVIALQGAPALGHHAAARIVEVVLRVAVVLLVDLVADEAAQERAAQGGAGAAVVELVADHAADHRAGDRAVHVAVMGLAALLVVTLAPVPALFAPALGLIDGARVEHSRQFLAVAIGPRLPRPPVGLRP